MRLIDADALKRELHPIDDIPAVTECEIDDAPTVEAIPIEWLEAWNRVLRVLFTRGRDDG